jgi:hypothetical protein
MYVELRTNQAVHLNLKMKCGLTEQTVNVVSCVPTSSVGPSLILTKQRTEWLPDWS